jgi:hypothetical protein
MMEAQILIGRPDFRISLLSISYHHFHFGRCNPVIRAAVETSMGSEESLDYSSHHTEHIDGCAGPGLYSTFFRKCFSDLNIGVFSIYRK